MAIIGFIFLMFLGLGLVAIAGTIFFGSAMFGGTGVEAVVPAIFAGLIFWAAFHFAPFTITFVGR
jgi:hypothetical protein